MSASIWLQLNDAQETRLQHLVDRSARAHGTVTFRPHLTVCSLPDLAALDAAASYVQGSGLLPLEVAKTAVTGAVITPFRAVFIEVENTPQLQRFRERLSTICGTPLTAPPHISLLYTLDRQTQQPRPDMDAAKLRSIADECAAEIPEDRFLLVRAIVNAGDGDQTNVRSWRLLRAL